MVFCTVEGLDGSGKSTVLDAITSEYPGAVTTSEPSDLEYGQLVRHNLSQDVDPLVDFYLFMADRKVHIEQRVRPADESGKLVVSDRYADSTRAYQPVALTGDDRPFDSPWEAKTFIEQTMAPWCYEPDLTLYIDVTPETAIERSSGDEKFEDVEFLTEVHKNYIALADARERIVTIDGEQRKDSVKSDALETIERFI